MDPQVPVYCDAKGCRAVVDVELEIGFATYQGGGAHFDHSDEAVEKALKDDHDWTVDEDGPDGARHFCESCSEER